MDLRTLRAHWEGRIGRIPDAGLALLDERELLRDALQELRAAVPALHYGKVVGSHNTLRWALALERASKALSLVSETSLGKQRFCPECGYSDWPENCPTACPNSLTSLHSEERKIIDEYIRPHEYDEEGRLKL